MMATRSGAPPYPAARASRLGTTAGSPGALPRRCATMSRFIARRSIRLEPDRYQIDGRWFLMDRHSESIRVRRNGLVEKTVRWTRHGPVISDFAGRVSGPEVLSLRWTAHEASQDFSGLYRLNRARNWDEFLDALSYQSRAELKLRLCRPSGKHRLQPSRQGSTTDWRAIGLAARGLARRK